MEDDNPTLFVESHLKGKTTVTLENDVSIPGRTEMLVNGHVSQKLKSMVGMVGPVKSQKSSSIDNIQIAYAVVTPHGRNVPLTIMNTSNDPIELVAGTNVAEFSPLVNTASPKRTEFGKVGTSVTCGAVGTAQSMKQQFREAIDKSLSSTETKQLEQILCDFSDVFSEEIGHVDMASHTIDTGDHAPIKQRPRRLPYVYRDEANKQIRDMLEQNVIQPSTSPWSSPIVLVRKKDGQLRFCVDYRKLNQITQNDAHPLP